MAENTGNNIFQTFLKNTENKILKRKMRDAIADFETGNNFMYLQCLRITATDACTDAHFRNVMCRVEEMNLKDTGDLAAIGCFFSTGCRILKDFFADDPKIPLDRYLRRSLQRLLEFLSSDHSALLNKIDNEAGIARQYAEYLLRPLVADEKTCVIGSSMHLETSCCGEEHPFSVKCGDTSFGLQNGWHGEADVLINCKNEGGLPVVIGNLTNNDNDSLSSFDEKSDEKGFVNFSTQIFAETIVFSYLQQKMNSWKLQNNLIPGIGIVREKLIVSMYDCENDVLLGSHAMDLFEEEDIYVKIVMILWLVLNYDLFCTGLIDDFKGYKANFQELLDDESLKRYRTEVTMPLKKDYHPIKMFDPNELGTPRNLKRKLDSYPEMSFENI